MARLFSGRVSSTNGDKTIVVTVARRKTHPIYKKQYTVHSKFMAHDEKNEAKIDDRVVIKEIRPISAKKKFCLERILERKDIRFQESDATADIIPETPEKASV